MAKRKIHLTESQLKEIMRKLNEDTQSIDIDLTPAAEVGGAQKAKEQFSKQTSLMGSAGNNARGVIDGTAIPNLEESDEFDAYFDSGLGDENLNRFNARHMQQEPITKRQIKEARLNKLIQESFKMVKKKDLQ